MQERYWPQKPYYDGKIMDFQLPWWEQMYPNFHPSELASYNDKVLALVAALDALQAMRTEFGFLFKINSAYRSAEHNKAEGGRPRSMHLFGHAYDISLSNGKRPGDLGFIAYDGCKLEALARKHGFNGIGRYAPDYEAGKVGFLHVDMRNRAATWGAW